MGTMTDAEKTDARRFCWYPVYGAEPTPVNGYRYFEWYGNLEYKLSNMTPSEETVTRTYLTNLNTLETAIFGIGANLDTDTAGPWKHNANELRDRERLYDNVRRKLCSHLGVPPGPARGEGGGTLRLVV